MFNEEFKKKDLRNSAGKKRENVDYILVRDYVREIDIGAFQSEYGVKQRVSFNVILEVNSNNYQMHDNVDLVLSYDNIIEIIENEISKKRVALLETLAEQIALSCLCLKSVIAATVRTEKLDRGIGKLGVQISRTKAHMNSVQPNLKALHSGNLVIRTRIKNAGLFFISNRMLMPQNVCHLEEFFSSSKMSWVMCLPEIFSQFSEMNSETDTEILTMAIAQNAYRLSKKLKNWQLARNKTEVVFLLKEGVNCIWCPTDNYKIYRDDMVLNKDFALNMACHLTKELLMQEIYLFQKDKLSDVLAADIKKKGVIVKYCSW